MGIYYENLDDRTRKFMMKELEMDITNGKVYISPRLNSLGQANWEAMLRESIEGHNDDWLAYQLSTNGCMSMQERRRTPSGGMTIAKVPVNAMETLSEGEFNRYYARGLCARAIEDGIQNVEVCRGKQVQNPRAISEVLIGQRIEAKALLEDLRQSQGVESSLKVPPGPNSGLTIRFPK